MKAMSRRVRKLETRLVDATGLIPHSEPWFAFYTDKITRSFDGEDIGDIRIPIEALDRLVERADREDEKARDAGSPRAQ
jgi:hypothetical protein